MADNRLGHNPALQVPLPTEQAEPARYLSREEVERLTAAMPPQYQALIMVGAYAGLHWGEAVGLRWRDIDLQRSWIRVTHTAVKVGGQITLDNLAKPTRSILAIPVARSVMRRIAQHHGFSAGQSPAELLFTAANGGPLFRSLQPNRAAPGRPDRRPG